MDGDAAVLARHRDDRVVLDVQLLLVADAVVASMTWSPSAVERRVDVALEQLVVGEHDRCVEGVEDGRQGLRAERDPLPRLPQGLAIRGGQQRDRLRLVLDLAPPTGTRIGWSSAMLATTLRPGMSTEVTTATFDQSKAGSSSIASSRAWGTVERIVAPYQAPGKTRSSAYRACPVSLAGPSRRVGSGTATPRTGAADRSAGLWIVKGWAPPSDLPKRAVRRRGVSSRRPAATQGVTGVAPVCSPPSMTTVPFTITYGIPIGNCRGLVEVAVFATVAASNSTRSAASPSARTPRSRSPRRADGAEVIFRTASSSEDRRSSRTNSPRIRG